MTEVFYVLFLVGIRIIFQKYVWHKLYQETHCIPKNIALETVFFLFLNPYSSQHNQNRT